MAKNSARLFGAIFVIAGIWGFIQAPILGLFAANAVSSIIHVIVGVILFVVATKPSVIVTLKTVGVVYIIFALLGFYNGASVLGIFPTNGPADWLYIVLGIIIAAFGWSSKKGSVAAPSGSASPSTPSSPQM